MRRSSTATCAGPRLRRTRCAYTLLELLIASVLIATLMVAAWGLMTMYSSFLIAGRSQAAEQQLSRSLMDLLATDLRASATVGSPAIGRPAEPSRDDPASHGAASLSTNRLPATADGDLSAVNLDAALTGSEPAAGAKPLPKIAFDGDEHSLTLIGVREEPLLDTRRLRGGGAALTQAEDAIDAGTDAPPVGSRDGAAPAYAAAPQWTRVLYRFVPPQAAGGDEHELAPGLHRFEIPVEFQGLLLQDNHSEIGSDIGSREPFLDAPDEFSTEFLDSIRLLLDQNLPGVTHEHVPEVVACRFEYFSGSTWQRQWSASPEIGRPLAVRVSLRLLTSEESRQLGVLLGTVESNRSPADKTAIAGATTGFGGGDDSFAAFHTRLYRRTFLTELDRDAVRRFDATETAGSVASAQLPLEAE